jgi:hypothetical protein
MKQGDRFRSIFGVLIGGCTFPFFVFPPFRRGLLLSPLNFFGTLALVQELVFSLRYNALDDANKELYRR